MQGRNVAVDEAAVYWTELELLRKAPKDGSPISELGQADHATDVALGAEHGFYTDFERVVRVCE
jgi:hypothetical protein